MINLKIFYLMTIKFFYPKKYNGWFSLNKNYNHSRVLKNIKKIKKNNISKVKNYDDDIYPLH